LTRKYQNEVTTVICRKIRPGHEKDYNNWIRRYLTLERNAPGYVGTSIIIPGGSKSPLRSILNPFIGQWPILGNAVIYTAILVVVLT
jgi:antibiotic biosynthesis monooxygenase (ABM) superfamily enzyme